MENSVVIYRSEMERRTDQALVGVFDNPGAFPIMAGFFSVIIAYVVIGILVDTVGISRKPWFAKRRESILVGASIVCGFLVAWKLWI